MLRKKILSMVLLVGMLIAQSVPRALAATYCDQAQFVSDLTAPDGSSFAPGAGFTKTWRLMNIGTCTWSTSYSLVWVGGEVMGALPSISLPVAVPPGQMVDLSINLTAPTNVGNYKAFFKLSNSASVQFGIGESASDPFWVDINVVQTSAVIYDFVASAPYAQWRSGAGIIPFPGTSGDSRGFGYQVNNPHLEDDSLDSSPGLLTVPQNKFNGYIQATYPEFQVQPGDHLQTLVNCEFGATGCNVTFRIDYLLPNGAQRTLWSWREAYDRRFYRADIDLSSLAGQRVRFVFMLLSSGFASGDRAIWGSPRIVRAGTTQPPGPPPTLTPLPPPPATPTPLGQPPPTVAPSGCDRATFVTDVTVPDGTIFAPGAAFTKTWRLKNTGACPWTTSYKLVYYSGEQMSAPTTVNLPWNVAFDQTVDISVNMVAPTTIGEYRGFWILSNAAGQFFGIGAGAADPVWVEISVAGESPMATGYDFTSNVCSAEWKSGAGRLPCPGANGNSSGFVLKLDVPQQEDGTIGAPGLLAVPQNRYNGYIQGFYPTFTVQPGDRFKATIGCEFGAACYLTYRLDYMAANGYIGTFWQWREQNEGKVYNADIDLGPLAGRSVRFILTVLATGNATNDRALWGAPRIVRATATPPPVTQMVTPSATSTSSPTNDWLLYTNSLYGFQFRYPPQSQRFFETPSSILIQMPIRPGTNLREKYLQMTVRENVTPCQSPLAESGTPGTPENVVINGISFLKQTAADAGVGHLHEWVGYSTLKNNACISMEFVLHSLNADNSEPPLPEFDKPAESAVFLQVMQTFAWVSPVATPTFTTEPPTFTPLPPTVEPRVVSSPNIRKLFMIDLSNGWAIGNSYVLRTGDGGATWYNMTMPGVSSVLNGFFQDANKGWVLTPEGLYRTVESGIRWAQYSVPFTGGYIQFLDDRNGFVLSGEPSGMQKHAVSLYQTTDGGATWTLKFANDPSQPNNTLPFSGHKLGMAFRDTSTGWVGGDYPTPGYVYLYKTSDSGVTWSQQSLALPAGYENSYVTIESPRFFGPNDAILPVWLSTNAGRDLFTYESYNGGATWTLTGGSILQGRNTDFISVRDGFAWDTNGFFHVTRNAGWTWSQVTPNVNFGDDVLALDFVSEMTGWIAQNSANGGTPLYRTTNGGNTWTLVSGTASQVTPPAQVLPDLAIVQMRIELQNTSCLMPGDPMGIRVWIKNNGQVAAAQFTVNVNSMNYMVPGLGAGETTAIFFPAYSNPVTTIVDQLNTVVESDESNNSRSEMVPVPTPPLPCAIPTVTATPAPSPTELTQAIVNALNARNFDTLRAAMDQSVMFAYWQSQGTPYSPDLAIEQLRTGHLSATPLVPDPGKNLVDMLDGLTPYSVMGLDPARSYALFVARWGLDGQDEAILYVTQRPNGSYYWYGVLIAKGGFGATSDLVSHEAFCADTRLPALIEQLKASMNQSNGDMFASLVSPTHGVDVRLWAYNAPVNFSTTTARNVFTGTEVYTWGSGPAGGTEYGTGTFSQIIQPKMLEVFNAPNMETYCDNLTKVFPLGTPWPYPSIRYYNLYKPASSGQEFDFRTWLIGFEYINNQPYLHSMVTIVWEP